MSLFLYGASDDLVETEGDVSEEFQYREDNEFEEHYGMLVATSTGHVFRVRSGSDGWEIRLLEGDAADLNWEKRVGYEQDDFVEIDLNVTWVMCGNRLESTKR